MLSNRILVLRFREGTEDLCLYFICQLQHQFVFSSLKAVDHLVEVDVVAGQKIRLYFLFFLQIYIDSIAVVNPPPL